MTCQVILDFRAREDSIEDLRSYLHKILPETRGYDGCNNLYLIQNQDDPMALVVIEQWDTRPKYEKYLAWRTETGVVDELITFLDGEPTFRFFDYFGV